MADSGFQILLVLKPKKPVRPKRNPFEDEVPLPSAHEPPKSDICDDSTTADLDSAIAFSTPVVTKPSDGYAEYAQNFGIPYLPPKGANLSQDEMVGSSKPLITVLLPPQTSNQKIKVAEGKRKVQFARPGSQAPELVIDAAMHEKESITTEILEQTTRIDGHASRSKTNRRDMSKTALLVPRIVRPGIHEIGELISTSESDKLALERLRALDPEASKPMPAKIKRRFLIMPFRSSKVKTNTSLASNEIERARSGYTLALLTQALQDAVTEGNLPLTASLIDLGADINFISREKKTYHRILGVAVTTGHRRVVDYLITSGSDGASVDNALLTAYFTSSLDLLPKLVPHTDMYHLAQVDATQATTYNAESTAGSSLGLIAKDQTMPRELRCEFLNALMSDKRFDANKVVLRTYDLLNGLLYEYTTLTTLAYVLDLPNLGRILTSPNKSTTIPRLTFSYIQCPTPIQCLRPQNWKAHPALTLAVLKLIATEISRHHLSLPSHWPGEGPMSPLSCAVSGGSLDGTCYLLDVGADPETLNFVSLDGGRTGWSHTVLGWAAFNGWLEICQALVSADATLWRANLTRRKPVTPLLLACRGSRFEVVKYLLELDVSMSMIFECLDRAVQNDEPRIVKLLIEAGAPVVGATWIRLLTRSPHPQKRHVVLEMVDILLEQKGPLVAEAVLAAIDSGNFAALSKILENRCVPVEKVPREIDTELEGSETVPKDTDADTDNLGFNKNAPFSNSRWDKEHATDNKERTCLGYAREKEKGDFVTLLKGYGWTEVIGGDGFPVGTLEGVANEELVEAIK